jgi:hypothetical protein
LQYISERSYLILAVLILFVFGWSHNLNNLANANKFKTNAETLDMQREYLTSMLESVPEKVVKTIFMELDFTYNERITIYRFENELFVPVGRYSINPTIKKYGRNNYPNSEGFIGKTWNNGHIHIEDLPDPTRAKRSYVTQVVSLCDISESILDKLSMKSRAYYCRNLLENSEPIAVVVFESLSPNLPKSPTEIDKLIESSLGQLLVNVIKTNLPLAKEESGR